MLDKAKIVMGALLFHGYEAYMVGGCVRDHFLGITPKDYDIATNALPDAVESIFTNTIPTGKQYGTITVMVDGEPFEVTTYRRESEYTDGRRPNVISFSDSILEDLSRRDFTINAMAMDIYGNIVDPFNGQDDLKRGIIRCVGNAKDRFDEDKLRVLRAIRFASRYEGFYIELMTYSYMDVDISKLSKERIREEFNKILLSKNASKHIRELDNLGLLNQIIPAIKLRYSFNLQSKSNFRSMFNQTLKIIDNVDQDLILRLSVLCCDVGAPPEFPNDRNGVEFFNNVTNRSVNYCEEIMTNLKYSRKEIDSVKKLVYNYNRYSDSPNKPYCARLINEFDGDMENLERLFQLQVSDIVNSEYNHFKRLFNVYKTQNICRYIIASRYPRTIKDLRVTGNDLMLLGYSGQEIGRQLKFLLEYVIDDSDRNVGNLLMEFSRKEK